MTPDHPPQELMTFEEAMAWWRDYHEHRRALRNEFEALFPALASRFPTLSGPGGPKPSPEQLAAAQAWLEAHPEARSRRCSFCAKTKEEVQRLIEGPGDVFICDVCVELYYDICYDTIEARRGNTSGSQ